MTVKELKKMLEGYTLDEVYGRYHPAFNRNKISFRFVKNNC